MPDVTDLIKKDHRAVEQLFSRFESSGDAQIAMQVCDELTIHAQLEEQLVYPATEKRVDAELTEHGEHEHDEMKKHISRIRAGQGDLRQHMSELQKIVQDHVQEEETELLPKAEQKLGGELERIGEKWQVRKQQLQGTDGRGDLADKKKDELLEMAKEADITGRHDMRKDELVEALERNAR